MNYQKSIQLMQMMYKLEDQIKDQNNILTIALRLAFKNKNPLSSILKMTQECIEDNEKVCNELFGPELTQSLKQFQL